MCRWICPYNNSLSGPVVVKFPLPTGFSLRSDSVEALAKSQIGFTIDQNNAELVLLIKKVLELI